MKALRDRAVWVGALGYFVDTYDLVLFAVVRKASLTGLGVAEEQQHAMGLELLNWQMLGMLCGGLVWGWLGDRWGRRSVLFGSILLYSLANLANGYLDDVGWYGWLRFVAGFGLAGELGAAITLVSERLSAEERGYGTMLVAGVGLAGAVVAAWLGGVTDWRTAYLVGGGLGLALLGLRMGTPESGLFQPTRFPLRHLLNFASAGRLLACVLIAVPIWFVAGVLVTFAPELGQALQVPGGLKSPQAVLYLYCGATLGDFLFGWISQRWRSRRRVVGVCLVGLTVLSGLVLSARGWQAQFLYPTYFWLGVFTGYWSVFVTLTAEQFGSDVRATATTSAPNFVRGAVVPITAALKSLQAAGWGTVGAAAWVGLTCLGLALVALSRLRETFGLDLNFLERDRTL